MVAWPAVRNLYGWLCGRPQCKLPLKDLKLPRSIEFDIGRNICAPLHRKAAFARPGSGPGRSCAAGLVSDEVADAKPRMLFSETSPQAGLQCFFIKSIAGTCALKLARASCVVKLAVGVLARGTLSLIACGLRSSARRGGAGTHRCVRLVDHPATLVEMLDLGIDLKALRLCKEEVFDTLTALHDKYEVEGQPAVEAATCSLLLCPSGTAKREVVNMVHREARTFMGKQAETLVTMGRYREALSICSASDCASCSRAFRMSVDSLDTIGELAATTLASLARLAWFARLDADHPQS